MKYFEDMGAYKRVPRDMVQKVGGKLVSVRWIDVNKGDVARP